MHMSRMSRSIPGLVPGLLFLLLVVSGSWMFDRNAEPGAAEINEQETPALQDGDIVFQCSVSPQCQAIQEATHSPYTHCGMVFFEKGIPMVLEAVQPVRIAAWSEWRSRGNGHYVVKRLRGDNALTEEDIVTMRAVGQAQLGKPYDARFLMDDERIYCSELVYKVYRDGAGITVGTVERFGDMDLTRPEAHRVLVQRFGDDPPLEEPVITPASLFRSSLLFTVDSVGAPPNS